MSQKSLLIESPVSSQNKKSLNESVHAGSKRSLQLDDIASDVNSITITTTTANMRVDSVVVASKHAIAIDETENGQNDANVTTDDVAQVAQIVKKTKVDDEDIVIDNVVNVTQEQEPAPTAAAAAVRVPAAVPVGGAVDVEAEKDAFVEKSTALQHEALDVKEQTEATLDKLNEVHYDLIKNTNALLSAVDPTLTATIAATEERIAAVEKAAADATATASVAVAVVADSAVVVEEPEEAAKAE